MRILIYAHSFAPRVGGAETYVMLLARELAARPAVQGVTVATPTPRGAFDDADLPFHVLRRPSWVALWRLIGWADAVLLAGPCFVPLAMALIRRKPVAVEHHGYQAVCPNGLLFEEPRKAVCPGHFMHRRYGRCLRCVWSSEGWGRAVAKVLATFPRRWMCARVGANIAVTTHVARRLDLPRTRTIYHGVPLRAPGDEGLASGPPVLVYVGRLVSEKGIPLLFEAARILKDEGWRFLVRVIGDGPERGRLERMVADLQLGNVVTFAGYLRGEALEYATRDAAALVMPSVREETAGLASIEQMMRGRLVVAADIGGLGEIVDGAGLTFSAGDARALAACLRQVLQDPSLTLRMGREARARAVRMFTVDRMADEHLAVLESLAAARSSGHPKGAEYPEA